MLDIAEALVQGDLEMIGALAEDSFHGARDLYEISSVEMEKMMAAMLSGPGVIGARQAGAGFGGCMVAFVKENEVEVFSAHVQDIYKANSGIEPKVYPVQSASGAGVVSF